MHRFSSTGPQYGFLKPVNTKPFANTKDKILNSVTPLGIGINDFYDTDVVTVNVVPNSDIVYPLRNRILAIDENNYQSIQLEVVAES